ncbi:group II intron maturase-specific domain-containing protein [Sporolactobacillus terrae]|uniref:Group II intron maturase-specific domain-containing protein n=1 Tax=Sporolactobacillus terrae TaxID=269673 RepID=A0A5K7WW17_9BACL|nr:group II intron maturase-specific domain-containing protein [Sporolactobacillus terrae]BBN98871.1 hypothetical protein St703_15760 [Sporolactobacillus terrae]
MKELFSYLIRNKEELIKQMRNGSYKPQPVRRVEIPKPDGSKRKLGVPTVRDRLVQQAILQVMERIVDPTFSDNSFGFRPHIKSKKRFERKLKQLTKRSRSGNIRGIIKEINEVTTGWINYYGISYMQSYIRHINQGLRRRIRQIIWKRWKKVKTRYKSLMKPNVPKPKAWEWANTRKGYRRIACSYILHRSITNKILEQVGLKNLVHLFEHAHLNY